MPTIASKIFKVVKTEPENESNEFVLCWFGNSGEPNSYLFTDWRENTQTQTTQVNRANSENINTVPADSIVSIGLTAEDVEADMLEAFKSLATARYVYRLHRSGDPTPLTVADSTITKRANAPRYDFSCVVELPREPLFE